MEKEFDQINFDDIISNSQDDNIKGNKKHMEPSSNVLKAEPKFNTTSEVDNIVELDAVDLKQNQEHVEIQFHAPDFVRKSPFNDDLQMDSHKKTESHEILTHIEIPNANSNTKHDSDKAFSQPLDLESSQSIRDKEMVTSADGDLTVIKLSKLQSHPSLNEQVLYVLIILDRI